MRIAIITQGYQSAGGVQAVARWVVDVYRHQGHDVDVYDLAASRRDPLSRSLKRPRSWLRGPQIVPAQESGVYKVGSRLAEVEYFRYFPSTLLKATLAQYDAAVAVAGAPALGRTLVGFDGPKALQVATRVRWERASIIAAADAWRSRWMSLMTASVAILEPHVLRDMSTVLVENYEMADEVRRLAPDTKTVLAPPGIDCVAFRNEASWAPLGPIVSVGRLGEPRKGWGRLVEAYAQLSEANPEVPDLVLAGRGSLGRETENRIDELGVRDRVAVRSNLPFEDVLRLLHGASVFWQTSYEEGLGIAVIEAMAAGLPVVATETAGTKMSVLDGVTGYLVDQDSDLSAVFAMKTQRILAGEGDLMAKRAVERAFSAFDSAATADAFLAAIDATEG